MDNVLEQLLVTNSEHGYGAYFGVATRRVGLSRWQRGGVSEVVNLPALFVDIDREPREALADLKRFPVLPSVVVFSGFGIHAYWLLKEPLKENVGRTNQLLSALARRLHGDSLTVAQCMRLPSSYNTKPQRHHTLCQVNVWRPDVTYEVAEFAQLLPVPTPSPRKQTPTQFSVASAPTVNSALIAAVADSFRERGYRRRESWLNGPCPFSHRHKRGDVHRSFGFNTATGYGYCFVCGTILLRDLCGALGFQPAYYGGLLAASTA
ncbi:MAG: hypothetical protein KF716_25765 [Anaerolineae bacterium]|nr:hypothetical protein [Anaerolineae bacterium]